MACILKRNIRAKKAISTRCNTLYENANEKYMLNANTISYSK